MHAYMAENKESRTAKLEDLGSYTRAQRSADGARRPRAGDAASLAWPLLPGPSLGGLSPLSGKALPACPNPRDPGPTHATFQDTRLGVGTRRGQTRSLLFVDRIQLFSSAVWLLPQVL